MANVEMAIQHSDMSPMLDTTNSLKFQSRKPKKISAWLSNPFINYIFNNQDFKRSGPLKEIIIQLCENPSDYAILVPSTIFLMTHADVQTKKPYSEMCKDLEFILSHIVRLDVSRDQRIRTHKEFTTLNNKVLSIKADSIKSVRNFKYSVDVTILRQEFIRGFANYIPLGTCFHLIHISESILTNYEYIGIAQDLLTTMNVINGSTNNSLSPTHTTKSHIQFVDLMDKYEELKELDKKFGTLFEEYNFKKCKAITDLDQSFSVIMKRGSAMFNTLQAETFTNLLNVYSENELTEMIYNYLEENIYPKFWTKFVKLSPHDNDEKLVLAYENLKWLSITEVGLPDKVVSDIPLLMKYTERVKLAIAEFKKILPAPNSNQKCLCLIDTIEILSAGSTIDADTLITLLIFVICLSKVNNLNCILNYIQKYSYAETNIESGMLGYAISSLEVAIKYFHDDYNMDGIIAKSLQNEVLWRLIGSVSSDLSLKGNKEDDEKTFEQIEKLLKPFNEPNSIPLDSFVKSRSLNGESCIMFALKQHNEELMKVLLQFDYIFTLDDILEDQDIEGSNLLSVALDMEHPIADTLAMIIKEATDGEIMQYINKADINERTVGHFMCNSFHLIEYFGMFINWAKKDILGNTPFMIYTRCYDHPNYLEMMKSTIKTVEKWYQRNNRVFSYTEHVDNKGNSIMHAIRDPSILKLFLKTFELLELNCLNDANQSAITLAIRYNRIENVEILMKDERTCMSIVDPVSFMSALDYVKLERWDECVNREIAKTLEVQFIETEYGETLNIACVRARFEPAHGLCCYFRVVNNEGCSDIILVPFECVVKVLKLLKQENSCIPFDFSKPDLWFPRHSSVSMKGNISSSNKMKINSLINNLNLMIQALMKNGTLKYTHSLQNYLLVPQTPFELEVKAIDEKEVLKNIYEENFNHRKEVLFSQSKFKSTIIRCEDIIAFDAFLDYTIEELDKFGKCYSKFYRTLTLSDVEAKDLDKLRTDIPWIVTDALKFRECRVEDSCDIFLDKMRLLFATVQELIKSSRELKITKVRRWKKLRVDLKTLRSEIDRVAGGGVDGSQSPTAYNGPADVSIKNNRNHILSKVFKQIDIVTGECHEEGDINEFRKDIIKVLMKGKYDGQDENFGVESLDIKDEAVSKDNEEKSLTEMIILEDFGVTTWFVEKKRIAYVKRLLETFLKYRIEIFELDIELRKKYESLATFVSKFYQFRIDLFKNAYKCYAMGKIGELKREVQAWELGLREHQLKGMSKI